MDGENSIYTNLARRVYGSYPVISIPSEYDWEQPAMNPLKTKLKKIFSYEKQTFNYLYDFGDDWFHKHRFFNKGKNEDKYFRETLHQCDLFLCSLGYLSK